MHSIPRGLGIALAWTAAAGLAAAPVADVRVAEERPDATAPAAGRGPLDGMIFAGKIGPTGDPDLDDQLHFDAGQFWSRGCIACKFRPGVYWTRTAAGVIHFQGTMHSTDRGTLEYSGRVVDGRVVADIAWTKTRWYWTINRNLTFVGSLAPAVASVSAIEAERLATTPQPPGEESPRCNRY